MIDNKFLYFQTHDAFNEQLDGGNISQGSIAFIEDSSTIWTHGKEYAVGLEAKDYDTSAYSGYGRVYLPKNIKYRGLYFDNFIQDAYSHALNQSLNGVPDAIYFDTDENKFVAEKNGSFYKGWSAGQAYYYLYPAEAYDYVNAAEDAVYKWDGTTLASSEDGVKDNILTQDMIVDPNTIYVIQYDYDLNGQSITIPENCILQFEGGSIDNTTSFSSYGGIVGSNTIVVGTTKEIDNSVLLSGTWQSYGDLIRRYGSTAQRPILTSSSAIGYQYFDTTLGSPVFWNGSEWVLTTSDGEENVIESVKVNNVELTPDANKAVNVTVPTQLSDLTSDSTHRVVTDAEKASWDAKADADDIEGVAYIGSTFATTE